MGSMSSLSAQVIGDHLCGSCQLYTGNIATGNLTGSCPIDGEEIRAERKPCGMYEEQEGKNEN